MISDILNRLWNEILNLGKRQLIRFFLLPWFVFTVLAFLALFMPMSFIPPFAEFTSNDEIESYLLTKAIVEKQSFAITDYADTLLMEHPWDLIVLNGEVYIRYLPGPSFIGIPFYILGIGIAWVLNLEGILLERFLFFCTCQVSILSAAYTVLLIYKSCKLLGASDKSSFLSAYIFAFATINLVYARTFFAHSLGAMLILYSVYTILRVVKGVNTGRLTLILSGVILGYSTIVRFSNALLIFPILLLLLLNKKLSKFALFLVGFCTIIPVHMLYNYALFGNPFTTIYTYAGPDLTTTLAAYSLYSPETFPSYVNLWWQSKESYFGLHILVGLFILLFSPFRGLFFYSPVLILSLFGIFREFKQKGFDIAFFLLTSFMVIAVAYAHLLPFGTWTWSSRYLIEVIPLLVIPISVVLDKNRSRLFNASFNGLYVWSIFAMVLGIYPKFGLHPVPLFKALTFLFENNIYLILVTSIFSFILVILAHTGAYVSINEKIELKSGKRAKQTLVD